MLKLLDFFAAVLVGILILAVVLAVVFGPLLCFLFLGWKAAIGAMCWSIAIMGTVQFFMGVAKASKK